MCTAATYRTKDHYFGRNLDMEYHYHETVTIMPRNFPLAFRCLPPSASHFAMIGMATVDHDYPLYYDATNEYGLSMAALNFPVSAKYNEIRPQCSNVTSFELIPWILGNCKTAADAASMLKEANIVNLSFSEEFPVTALHWIIADANRTLTVEAVEERLQIYENTVGILTNEPPFPYHMMNLQNYLQVTSDEAVNRFAPGLSLKAYSNGMGGLGLPGDLSSSSRFVKAAFTKLNSVSKSSESESISQMFHILGSVAQQRGCVKIGNLYEKTVYSSCCNTTKGIYYYTTYENSQITAVRLHGTNLNGNQLVNYPLIFGQQIHMQN